MEIYGLSILPNYMLTKKNSKKMHTNLNKWQVHNCLGLPGQNFISTSNHKVKSFPAVRVEISSQQTGIM